MNKAAVNQHLQFTSNIWANNLILPPFEKKENFQICAFGRFPFLYMNMIWSPKRDLKFGIFRKKVQQLKYVRKVITHIPGTLHAIPSGVLNQLAKITSRKPNFNSKIVGSVYPYYANTLREAGLAPTIFPEMG